MSDSPEKATFGGGGKLYQDVRDADTARREAMRQELLTAEERAAADLARHALPTWPDTPHPVPPPATAPPVVVNNDATPKQRRYDVRELFSTVLELTGIVAIAVGGWLIAPYVGLIFAGIALVTLGVASSGRIDMPTSRSIDSP